VLRSLYNSRKVIEVSTPYVVVFAKSGTEQVGMMDGQMGWTDGWVVCAMYGTGRWYARQR
jgi:hypothetical protein